MSSYDAQSRAQHRASSRDRKRRKRMLVTGAGVFELQRLLKAKGKRAGR